MLTLNLFTTNLTNNKNTKFLFKKFINNLYRPLFYNFKIHLKLCGSLYLKLISFKMRWITISHTSNHKICIAAYSFGGSKSVSMKDWMSMNSSIFIYFFGSPESAFFIPPPTVLLVSGVKCMPEALACDSFCLQKILS